MDCRYYAGSRTNPKLQHIPVIMISALDEIDSIVRCIEAGAEDYVPKPFDPVLLGARIDASLERKRLRDREHAFTNELRVEKGKTEALLLNILPGTIVSRIRNGEIAIADRFPDATILFADLVGFTDLAGRHSPGRVVELLNRLFSAFDKLAKRLKVEKIKTIGDAYMAAGGLPEESPGHALSVAEMALGMIEAVRETGRRFGEALEVRIGIHSGDVVAGLIGQHRSIYDVWGDTVNIASRLEFLRLAQSHSNIGKHLPTCQGWVPLRVARAGRAEGSGCNADLFSRPTGQIKP